MKTKLKRIAFAVVVMAILAAAVFVIVPKIHPGGRPTRVLFIGNSYTYFNNLPEIFARLAQAGGRGKVETRMDAPGGWRLKDHWEKGEARKALRDGRWDFVVLQDQSTLGVNDYFEGKPRVTSDEVFKPYAEKWAAAIREAGATPVFYLTWARKATPEDQAALNYAYMTAAREGKAVVAPVGTMAVIDVAEFTVKLVAAVPLKVTAKVQLKVVPVIVTDAPSLPLVGVRPVNVGGDIPFTNAGVTRSVVVPSPS